MLITYPYRNNLSAYAAGFVGLEGRHTRPSHSGGGGPGCGARGPRRGLSAAPVGGDDTTASQISHVIYRGHFSRHPKNVAIPTMQIQCLNESSRNYVRSCWLTARAEVQAATRPHWCGGRRRAWRAWLRCPWAAAGPGRTTSRRAERSSRRGRRAGGQAPRRSEIRRAAGQTAPYSPPPPGSGRPV